MTSAPSISADTLCLDLWGLANAEVAAAKRNHTYQVGDIDRLSKQTGARIAIIYDNWFVGGVPPAWIRIGRWTILNNVLLGGDAVSFCAVDPEAERLRESPGDFSTQLPSDVTQREQQPLNRNKLAKSSAELYSKSRSLRPNWQHPSFKRL